MNGNEAEVKKEEERREEIEKRAFVYRKYGMMNFVSGGFLVGDKITKKGDIKQEPEVKVEIKSEPESEDNKAGKKDKKRKRVEVEAVEVRTTEEPKLKRKRKSMDLREEAKREIEQETDVAKQNKKDKKAKKEKSKKSKKSTSDSELSTSLTPTAASDPEALTDKAKRKAEKKARKEEKKLKKALKKAAKEAAKSNGSPDRSSSESEEESAQPSSVSATGTSTPTVSSAGLTFNARGMHAVRQKWIRQKRAATMDAQAMKEVCLSGLSYSVVANMCLDFHDKDSVIVSFPQSMYA